MEDFTKFVLYNWYYSEGDSKAEFFTISVDETWVRSYSVTHTAVAHIDIPFGKCC